MNGTQYNFRFKIENNLFEVDVNSTCFKNFDGNNYSLHSMHFHKFTELFLVIDGSVTIVTEKGKTTIDKGIVIVPPFLTHYSIRKGEVFNFSFLIKEGKSGVDFSKIFKSTTTLKLNENQNVLKYVSILKDSFLNKDSFVYEKAELLFKLLFWEIKIINDAYSENLNENSLNYTSKIENFIFNNYKNNVTLKDLATHLCLSTRQTSRITHQNYQKSFSTLLNERRLYVASQLLLNSKKSMVEIAESVNFNTENYFYSQFKKHYGLTPLQYRKKYFNTVK